MKKLLFFPAILITLFANSQIVNIPDSIFKACLVSDPLINTNSDSEIQLSEATAFTGTIRCNGTRFQPTTYAQSVTGLSAFTNITEIDINNHALNAVDLSQNTSLENVYMTYCGINTINLNNLSRLKILQLSVNNITNIDYSSSDSIRELRLLANTLTDTVDVKDMIFLEELYIGNSSVKFIKNQNTPLLREIKVNQSNLDSIVIQNSPQLRELDVDDTDLTHLDVSNHWWLGRLEASNCSLSTVTFGGNNRLSTIRLAFNNIQNLQLNTMGNANRLAELDLRDNNLVDLDLSSTNYARLLVRNNNLQSLNLKNGTNTLYSNFSSALDSRGNPNLSCIQVDDIAFSDSTWTSIDPTTTFDTNCNYITSLTETQIEDRLSVYPNPSSGLFNLTVNEEIKSIEVFGFNGQKLEEVHVRENEIDLANYPKGIYFLRVQTANKLISKKLIKN